MTYCEELAHTVVEAGKSHHLLSVGWRPTKAKGIIQFESKSLRTRGGDGINTIGQEKTGVPAHSMRQEQRDRFLLSLPFLPFRPSVD